MEASQKKKCDVTIQFLAGGLVIHFAGTFHLSFSVQKLFKNFMLVLKIFFADLETSKRHYPEKICVDCCILV
jgi:hypothetical protein